MTLGARVKRAALRACGVWLVLLCASAGHARELWAGDDTSYRLSLDSAFKITWLIAHAPDDPVLFPQRTSETGLFRLRLSLGAALGEHVDTQLSYEQRARLSSDPSGVAGSGVLPASTPPPYRVEPIEQALIDRPGLMHRHELDRAYVALHFAPFELTLGRQALGLGRGVLFSAVDVFAPFSPLEVDREWRRGVDAVHAEWSFGEHVSCDVIGAADHELEDGALLGRVRGYLGDVDLALLGGKRAEDMMLGGTASAVLGDAEVHGEGALFRTDGRGIEQGWLGSQRWVAAFVAGTSYQLAVGRGLRLLGEYHYTGFGLRNVARDPTLLLDPAFQARLARGDTQLLSRHVVALVVSYDLADTVSASITALLNPLDASGVASPSLLYNYSDTVTLVVAGYVPWGKPPAQGRPRSEYGMSSLTGLLQLRIYD
jgi:hypothetical protein